MWRCQFCKRESTISKYTVTMCNMCSLYADMRLWAHADFDSSLDRSKAVYTFEMSEEQKYAPVAVLEASLAHFHNVVLPGRNS